MGGLMLARDTAHVVYNERMEDLTLFSLEKRC